MITASAGRQRVRLDRVEALLAGLSIGLLIFDGWVMLELDHAAPAIAVVREFVFAGSWVVVGLVAIALDRPLLARRLLVLAVLLAVSLPGALDLTEDGLLALILVTVNTAIAPLNLAAAAHLLLSFPVGRVYEQTSRGVLVATFAVAAANGLWWTLTDTTDGTACGECVAAPALVVVSDDTHRLVQAGLALSFVVVVVLICRQLVRGYRDAGQRERRLLRIPYAAALAASGLFTFRAVLGVPTGTRAFDTFFSATVSQAVGLLVPMGFLAALVGERLAYRRIGDLVVTLAAGGGTDLERSLSVALGDPQLRVAFPVADGFVDTQGRPTAAPEADIRTVVTAVGDPAAPLALIRHDRSLDEEPALVTAAGSATRLILENARLEAEVRAQLLEVRESRLRIVTATDEARARLERDLHDGAQQRLLAVGIALQLLRQQPGDRTLIDAADGELASALAEMRELACGIHPAVLTDLGLSAALDTLVHRLGERVVLQVSVGPSRRLAAPVEAAAYFATAEALTNALKHADPTRVAICVEDDGDRLRIRVSDDGSGGADPFGAGLLGVRDRLASVDGTLLVRSPKGAGTVLEMELPCA